MLKVKEVLHAREQRLFTMSQENAVLQDEVVNERQRSSDLSKDYISGRKMLLLQTLHNSSYCVVVSLNQNLERPRRLVVLPAESSLMLPSTVVPRTK